MMGTVIHSIRHWNHLPDALALMLVVSLQILWARHWMRDATPERKRLIRTGLSISLAFLAWGFSAMSLPTPAWLPLPLVSWGRAATLAWAGLTLALSLLSPILRRLRVDPSHHPARRAFLRATQGAMMGTPVAALGYGVFVQRHEIRLREENIGIPNLPKDLDGLKLVQLTDIHMGPFLDRRMLARAVDMANQTRANLTLVTGDLISYQGDPLDECLDELARLRADAGVLDVWGTTKSMPGRKITSPGKAHGVACGSCATKRPR